MPNVDDSKISMVAGMKSPGITIVQSLNSQCVGPVIVNNRGNPVSRIGPWLDNRASIGRKSVLGLCGHICHIVRAQHM